MTTVQDVQSPNATATEMEAVSYVISGAGHMEQNMLDRLVKSQDAVVAELCGWRSFLVDNKPVYIVVFKTSSHVGQHKTRLRELIQEQIPSLSIITT